MDGKRPLANERLVSLRMLCLNIAVEKLCQVQYWQRKVEEISYNNAHGRLVVRTSAAWSLCLTSDQWATRLYFLCR